MIIFIRIIMISNKYATISKERYKMYKDQYMNKQDLEHDMYLLDWKK